MIAKKEDIQRMREFISDAYPGMKWKARVAKMKTNQVVAIYTNMKNRIDKNGRYMNNCTPIQVDEFHQYNLFELGLEMV